jgi:hypothetical protein
MRHGLARGLVLVTAAAAAMSAQSSVPAVRLSVRDAVALYAQGDFQHAVRDLDTN